MLHRSRLSPVAHADASPRGLGVHTRVGVLSWVLGILLTFAAAAAATASPSSLQDYEKTRYTASERKLVAGVVAEVFSGSPAAQQQQAVRECLAYFHVVFHRTGSHHFEDNVAVMARWHQEVDDACERYAVPTTMARSILTWENSGSESATSYAACTGIGQLSRGAMGRAHLYGGQFATQGAFVMGLLCDLAGSTVARLLGRHHLLVVALEKATRWLRAARSSNEIAARHERMRVAAHASDERAVPRCNIEDSILYMRYLLDMYGDRMDLAISAYHNGIRNTDDVLQDWFGRHVKGAVAFSFNEREPLIVALRRHGVTYLFLWNDERTRMMLNGLLTMDGVPTTPANAPEALGDESDIYVWKTMAAAAALNARPAELTALLERYRGSQDESETRGFVPRAGSLQNLPGGIRVVPEVVEWVRSVRARFKARTGRECPLRLVKRHVTPTHASGLAVDLLPGHPVVLEILKEDWLFDRIYKRAVGGRVVHVCLNPREAALWSTHHVSPSASPTLPPR